MGQLPAVEVVALAVLAVRWVVGNRLIAGRRVVGTVGIGQDQHVAVLFMAEIVVDAFLFHQPADEVEAAFAVLHAVFPLAVGLAEHVFEVGETEVAEHLLDDLRDGHVLEDAAVGGTGQQPEPGTQGHLVAGELAGVDVLAAARDDVGGGQVQFVFERPPQFLAAAHVLEQQHIRPERAVDLGQAGGLCE